MTTEPAAATLAAARTRSPFVLLPSLVFAAACVAAAGVAIQPKLLLGVGAAACVLVLAFRMPVLNFGLLLFLTAVVPFEVLNRFSVGGGIDSPGLLPSDLLLVAGLAWAALALPRLALDRRRYLYLLAMLAFLLLVLVQVVHGLRLGYLRSTVGHEGRVLLGCGTFLIALPLLAHGPSRRRLSGALVLVALLLGSWGMLQWVGHFSYGAAGDVGVRSGVRLTSGGVGQLQGGQFGFPVAIIVCFAVLAFGEIRSRWWRAALLAAIALNLACCLVTFERSFWLDGLVGIAFVLLTAPRARRLKVLAIVLAAATLALGVLFVLSPATLKTASQRFNSIGSYASDSSVRYRVVESGFVYERIRSRPLEGSGLGATIFWGQPWAKVRPKSAHYSHDGYLWLAWKLGIPAAALLVAMLLTAPLSRTVPNEEPLSVALRRGAQGAICGLLLATITFPSFSQLSIAPMIGLVLALAVSPQRRRDPAGLPEAAQPATALSLR